MTSGKRASGPLKCPLASLEMFFYITFAGFQPALQ